MLRPADALDRAPPHRHSCGWLCAAARTCVGAAQGATVLMEGDKLPAAPCLEEPSRLPEQHLAHCRHPQRRPHLRAAPGSSRGLRGRHASRGRPACRLPARGGPDLRSPAGRADRFEERRRADEVVDPGPEQVRVDALRRRHRRRDRLVVLRAQCHLQSGGRGLNRPCHSGDVAAGRERGGRTASASGMIGSGATYPSRA